MVVGSILGKQHPEKVIAKVGVSPWAVLNIR